MERPVQREATKLMNKDLLIYISVERAIGGIKPLGTHMVVCF